MTDATPHPDPAIRKQELFCNEIASSPEFSPSRDRSCSYISVVTDISEIDESLSPASSLSCSECSGIDALDLPASAFVSTHAELWTNFHYSSAAFKRPFPLAFNLHQTPQEHHWHAVSSLAYLLPSSVILLASHDPIGCVLFMALALLPGLYSNVLPSRIPYNETLNILNTTCLMYVLLPKLWPFATVTVSIQLLTVSALALALRFEAASTIQSKKRIVLLCAWHVFSAVCASMVNRCHTDGTGSCPLAILHSSVIPYYSQ